MANDIDVGLKTNTHDVIILRILTSDRLKRDVFRLTIKEAKELARGLDLMASLSEKLKKEPL